MSVLLQPLPTSAIHSLPVDASTAHYHAPNIPSPVLQFERRLGDSEQSYFFPSRANGVNDMYLHIGFRSQEIIDRDRFIYVWAILRSQHPLLASSIEMHDYTDVRFKYAPPRTVSDALEDAKTNLEFNNRSKDELIDAYLNGPRTLSNQCLSRLFISQPEVENELQYEFMICATHYIGDGMSLHQFANHFFSLLGGNKQLVELERDLFAEIVLRADLPENFNLIPDALESKLVSPETDTKSARFRQAVAQVDFKLSQSSLIGGHSFPRNPKGPQPLHTIVPTVDFSREATNDILKACKARGVSISSALFALCNISWSTICKTNWEMPMMMYSALNLRPNLRANQRLDSYWFLAVGYFNIILPSFLPPGHVSSTFWYRAKVVQQQSKSAAKNPMLVSRSREMAKLRGQRARQWAMADDGIPTPAPVSSAAVSDNKSQVASNALIGLSMLGNLDGIYKHSTFPNLTLHTLTTGSRQRPGGMLLFSYTFAGKLFVSLGYDENGFDQEVVQHFWQTLLHGVGEFCR